MTTINRPGRNNLISVIIPVYNASNYIAKCIQSVIDQTYEPIEIIVVDDGSTDETSKILSLYTDSINYFWQQNAGPSSARNNGVSKSKGKYIAFLDADDIWYKEKLEDQIKIFHSIKDAGIVFSDMSVAYNNEVYNKTWIQRMNDWSFLVKPGIIVNSYQKILTENFIPTCSVLIRRDCFEDAGGFDVALKVGEDWKLWLNVCRSREIAFTGKIHGLVTRDKNMNLYDWQQYFTSFIVVMEQERAFAKRKYLTIIKSNLSLFYFNLGYHYLNKGAKVDARKFLLKSISSKINLPAVKSIIRSYL